VFQRGFIKNNDKFLELLSREGILLKNLRYIFKRIGNFLRVSRKLNLLFRVS
jgi:hypothetical protein